jgi:DNA modification methylase
LAESVASTRGGAHKVEDAQTIPFKGNCGKCGATRIDSQIGLEPTPEEYVEKIVAVFAEVWRVLRDDGTCWVNLGDSYAGALSSKEFRTANHWTHTFDKPLRGSNRNGMGSVPGLKPKDLVGIPWRVAFALQAAGWYLRSDIIWSKPNPMPESVTDRPTKAHEYIFLLTKRERYYFDQDAVREAAEATSGWSKQRASGVDTWAYTRKAEQNTNGIGSSFDHPAGRNIRTVWEIATQPYPNAHFATFPEEIAVRCIKAGTSEKGACKECGAPWARVTDISYSPANHQGTSLGTISTSIKQDQRETAGNGSPGFRAKLNKESKTTGWQPTCKHDAPTVSSSIPVPCIVLDPFSGAGTVPLVADKLNRRGIGLELKADYCRMAKHRCYDDAPLFAGALFGV